MTKVLFLLFQYQHQYYPGHWYTGDLRVHLLLNTSTPKYYTSVVFSYILEK